MAINTPGGGGDGTLTASETLPPGILTNISILTEGPAFDPLGTFATVSLVIGEAAGIHRDIQILSGYVSTDFALTWIGVLEVSDNMTILMRLRGDLDPVFRLRHQRLLSTVDGAIMRYIQSATNPT